jgi:hypothetical protein
MDCDFEHLLCYSVGCVARMMPYWLQMMCSFPDPGRSNRIPDSTYVFTAAKKK